MSNENLNDFHWKNKLEDVSNLSGEILIDKNAAWEKLHSRLRRKPRRIRSVWYWTAAACLMLGIIVPIITTNKKQDSIVKNSPIQKLLKKTTVPPFIPVKETSVADILPASTYKKKTSAPVIQIKKKYPVINDIVNQKSIPGNFQDQKNIQYEPVIVHSGFDKPLITALTVPVFKKKLKVIHVNELSDPVKETPSIAQHYERRAFQVKFINYEVYTSPSLPSYSTGFNILKTKNAP